MTFGSTCVHVWVYYLTGGLKFVNSSLFGGDRSKLLLLAPYILTHKGSAQSIKRPSYWDHNKWIQLVKKIRGSNL